MRRRGLVVTRKLAAIAAGGALALLAIGYASAGDEPTEPRFGSALDPAGSTAMTGDAVPEVPVGQGLPDLQTRKAPPRPTRAERRRAARRAAARRRARRGASPAPAPAPAPAPTPVPAPAPSPAPAPAPAPRRGGGGNGGGGGGNGGGDIIVVE
jgi:hypothetical protein